LTNSRKAPLSGISVLIIEDEFLIAAEAQRIVEDAGANNVVLANSIAAVRRLLASGMRFHVGILDLKLGHEDATPLIEDLRAGGIPFLVASGFDARLEIEGLLLLQKPYHDADMIGAIEVLVGRSPGTK
jgi:DNA-binding response OmpR family regulator